MTYLVVRKEVPELCYTTKIASGVQNVRVTTPVYPVPQTVRNLQVEYSTHALYNQSYFEVGNEAEALALLNVLTTTTHQHWYIAKVEKYSAPPKDTPVTIVSVSDKGAVPA